MKKTVCVDLDGVLAAYDGWKGIDHIGDPIPGAVEFVRDIRQFADVLIYTTRCCEDLGRGVSARLLQCKVRDWLDRHGFDYDEIYIGQGKPICACFIDDRAVLCDPQSPVLLTFGGPRTAYVAALERAKGFCGVFEHVVPPREGATDDATVERNPAISMPEPSAV